MYYGTSGRTERQPLQHWSLPRAALRAHTPTSSCVSRGRPQTHGDRIACCLLTNITHQQSKADAAYTETAEPGRDGRGLHSGRHHCWLAFKLCIRKSLANDWPENWLICWQ